MTNAQPLLVSVMALMVMTLSPLYGQSAETSAPETPRFTLGVQGALSAATLGGVEENQFGDLSYRFSLENYRVSGTFPLTPKLGLQPSVAYVAKGAAQHLGIEGAEGGASYEIKLDYIELSALGVASTATLGRSNSAVYALAGPTLGFQAGCTAEVTDHPGGDDFVGALLEAMLGEPVDCGDAFKGSDLGITVGVGWDWQPKQPTPDIGVLSGLKGSLEILYTLGLQSIASDESGDGSSVVGGDPKNRALVVWVGASLPL